MILVCTWLILDQITPILYTPFSNRDNDLKLYEPSHLKAVKKRLSALRDVESKFLVEKLYQVQRAQNLPRATEAHSLILIRCQMYPRKTAPLPSAEMSLMKKTIMTIRQQHPRHHYRTPERPPFRRKPIAMSLFSFAVCQKGQEVKCLRVHRVSQDRIAHQV